VGADEITELIGIYSVGKRLIRRILIKFSVAVFLFLFFLSKKIRIF